MIRQPIVTAAVIGASLIGCTKPEPAKQDTSPSTPNVQTRELEYREGQTPLKGFVAWDGNAQGKRPGILVVHEWWGHNAHARNQAKRLAEAGYVGFALDMFGDGKVTSHPDSAQAFVAEALKDPARLAARFTAALEQLKQDPHVDSTRVAAIGYCFGGAVVLNMARSGAPLTAVASFHGAIPPEAPIAPGTVKAQVLILTGGADPMVPAAQVEAFRKAMEASGATVRVVTYPNAKHSFTNPNADKVGMDGLAYNAEADQQSWAELLKLLQQVFP